MSRRPITIVIFTGFFLLGMLFLMWGILLPDIATDLVMSKVVSGALFLLFSMGMMIGAILGGKYVSKFDFLSLLAVLITLDAALLLVVSLLFHWQWVLFVVFTVGVVSSSIITIGHTLIAQLYAEKRFAMMGVMDFMFSLGTFAASFYVTFVYYFADSWRWPLRMLTLLLLALAAYTFVAASRNKRLVSAESRQTKRSLTYGGIIRQPVFLLLALVSFGYGAVEFGNANWFVSYAQQSMDYSGEDARNLLAFFTAGMVISRLCFAFFLRWFTTHRLAVILASMTFFGTLGIKIADSFYFIGVSNLLLGLGLGGLFPLILSAAMSIDADKGPVLSGVTIIGNSLGVQLASFSTGVWANFASLGEAFWIIPMAGAWLWLTAWYYSRELKRRHVDHVDPAAL